jgi:hypothetical protein
LPFTFAKKYFIKNTYKDIIGHDLKDNSELQVLEFSFKEDFEKIFGLGTTMGTDGIPTVIDFTKNDVIACIVDESNTTNSIEIIGLIKFENILELSCKRIIGKKNHSPANNLYY